MRNQFRNLKKRNNLAFIYIKDLLGKRISSLKKALDIKLRSLLWLFILNSKLSLENKIFYSEISLGLRNTALGNSIQLQHRNTSKVVRSIINTPFYVTKDHRDLKLTTIQEEIARAVTSYQFRNQNHPNPLVFGLMTSDNR